MADMHAGRHAGKTQAAGQPAYPCKKESGAGQGLIQGDPDEDPRHRALCHRRASEAKERGASSPGAQAGRHVVLGCDERAETACPTQNEHGALRAHRTSCGHGVLEWKSRRPASRAAGAAEQADGEVARRSELLRLSPRPFSATPRRWVCSFSEEGCSSTSASRVDGDELFGPRHPAVRAHEPSANSAHGPPEESSHKTAHPGSWREGQDHDLPESGKCFLREASYVSNQEMGIVSVLKASGRGERQWLD